MKYWYIITLFLLGSCNTSSEVERPIDLIPKEDLISIIIDLETLEAYFEQVHKRPVLYKNALDSSSKMVLKNKGYNLSQLESSLNYYAHFPDSIYNIYEVSLDTVNSLVNTYKSELETD